MNIVDEIRSALANEWIPDIYKHNVRPQRTRSYTLDVPERENRAEILYTLLGIELKVGKIRCACPDLATARYLRVFARIGCRELAVPYDITKISTIADDLETSWHKMLIIIDDRSRKMSPQAQGRMRSTALRSIREEVAEIGAGEAMPAFKQTTKQRKE
jgi:hypothetical protein